MGAIGKRQLVDDRRLREDTPIEREGGERQHQRAEQSGHVAMLVFRPRHSQALAAHTSRHATSSSNGQWLVDTLIAIDVAILPPPHVTELARRLSAGLPATESQGLLLDATRLPHITLTQQFVPAQDLPSVSDVIDTVVRGYGVLPLRIAGEGKGTRSVWLQIERTPLLDDLHRALMDALLPFERRGGGPPAFAGGDARPEDLQWVSGFRGSSSFERFTPHITLGHASRPPRTDAVRRGGGRVVSSRTVLHVPRGAPVVVAHLACG